MSLSQEDHTLFVFDRRVNSWFSFSVRPSICAPPHKPMKIMLSARNILCIWIIVVQQLVLPRTRIIDYDRTSTTSTISVGFLPNINKHIPWKWNRNVVTLTKFSSLAVQEVVQLATFSATSDENFVNSFSRHPLKLNMSISGTVSWQLGASRFPIKFLKDL